MSEARFLTPAELANSFVQVGVAKVRLPVTKMFLLAVLAGVFIGFGAHLASTVGTGAYPGLLGLKKLLMGAVFSVGLMLVVIPGAELFTGNNLMTMALCAGRIGWADLGRNWLVVYLGNLAGGVFLAWMIAGGSGLLDGPIGGTAIRIAASKVGANADISLGHNWAYFLRGIACNWLVCLAVMMAAASRQVAGKVLGIFFPIMAFVAMGFEHSVANMYFIPAGIFAKALPGAVEAAGLTSGQLDAICWGFMWTQNLLAVTAGNIVGGGIFVGMVYFYVYVHQAGASAGRSRTEQGKGQRDH